MPVTPQDVEGVGAGRHHRRPQAGGADRAQVLAPSPRTPGRRPRGSARWTISFLRFARPLTVSPRPAGRRVRRRAGRCPRAQEAPDAVRPRQAVDVRGRSPPPSNGTHRRRWRRPVRAGRRRTSPSTPPRAPSAVCVSTPSRSNRQAGRRPAARAAPASSLSRVVERRHAASRPPVRPAGEGGRPRDLSPGPPRVRRPARGDVSGITGSRVVRPAQAATLDACPPTRTVPRAPPLGPPPTPTSTPARPGWPCPATPTCSSSAPGPAGQRRCGLGWRGPGCDVVLADAATFPRDKPCGDGLTPRAIAELRRPRPGRLAARPGGQLGPARRRASGRSSTCRGPAAACPARRRRSPARAGRRDPARWRWTPARSAGRGGTRGRRRAGTATGSAGSSSARGTAAAASPCDRCRRLVVADGARSQLGRALGREWHRDTAYGVAARGLREVGPRRTTRGSPRTWSCAAMPASCCRATAGCSRSATARSTSASARSPPRARRPTSTCARCSTTTPACAATSGSSTASSGRRASALLPMGGAVSGVAGANWALIGDAAGCVNPLNGEGIDYGLETGRLLAQLLAEGGAPARPPAGTAAGADLTGVAGDRCGDHYGDGVLDRPAARRAADRAGPAAAPPARSGCGRAPLMKLALRVMGNLVDARGPRPVGPRVAHRRPPLGAPGRPPAVPCGRPAGLTGRPPQVRPGRWS